jgi:hypothetical protein
MYLNSFDMILFSGSLNITLLFVYATYKSGGTLGCFMDPQLGSNLTNDNYN